MRQIDMEPSQEKNESIDIPLSNSNSFDGYFGFGGFLAWLNLIGGIVGLLYYSIGQYNELEKLKAKATWAMLDQIKEAQIQNIFMGVSILMAGLTLFTIIQLLRGIYRNTILKR
ncbi:MAG: hypothetical protein DWP95_12785 [Proteobacteria bacterium]|nr:MAG: hypothetical protein DWP95_12785 [Pseudomonadota bacterium]